MRKSAITDNCYRSVLLSVGHSHWFQFLFNNNTLLRTVTECATVAKTVYPRPCPHTDLYRFLQMHSLKAQIHTIHSFYHQIRLWSLCAYLYLTATNTNLYIDFCKCRKKYFDTIHQRVQHGMVKILIPTNISEYAAWLFKQVIEDSCKQAHIYPDEQSKCHSFFSTCCVSQWTCV